MSLPLSDVMKIIQASADDYWIQRENHYCDQYEQIYNAWQKLSQDEQNEYIQQAHDDNKRYQLQLQVQRRRCRVVLWT
jgi:predicted phosphoribosyltransferase